MNTSQLENLEKLCVALESGKYNQTTGLLKSSYNHFCCLGVALDILSPEGWTPNVFLGYDHKNGTCSIKGWEMAFKTEFMDKEALEFFGLSVEDQRILYKMNDSYKSFVEIASYIRKNIMLDKPEN